MKNITYKIILLAIFVAGFAVQVKPARAAQNLINNPSMEQATNNKPSGWSKGKWGSISATFGYPSNGYDGSRSVRVNIKSRTSGDAKWAHQPVSVSPMTEYKYVDHYKSNIDSHLVVEYSDTAGNYSYQWLGSPAKSATVWQTANGTFTTPDNVATARVFHLIDSKGWLQIDAVSLTTNQTTPPPPPTSGDFQRSLVSLTFDDADKTIFQNGLPVLNQNGVKSTQYVMTGELDGYYYMTPAMVAAFRDGGHQLASHTVTHRDLTTLAYNDLVSELLDSKNYIASQFGVNTQDIASPYGAYNDNVINTIKQYYRSHRSVDEGVNTKAGFDIYRLKVRNIYNTTSLAQVRGWLAEAKANNSWLILLYHKVDNSNTTYSVTPTNLDSHIKEVKASGMPTVTVDQALGELVPQL